LFSKICFQSNNSQTKFLCPPWQIFFSFGPYCFIISSYTIWYQRILYNPWCHSTIFTINTKSTSKGSIGHKITLNINSLHNCSYAEDAVICCEYAKDAKRIRAVLPKRLSKFKLKLNKDKTKMIVFNRFEKENSKSFDFLGFTFYLGLTKGGRVVPKLKSCGKKLRSKLTKVNIWCKGNRWLLTSLNFFYQNFHHLKQWYTIGYIEYLIVQRYNREPIALIWHDGF